MAATVAPTLVPLLSSKYSTSCTIATDSTRWGSPAYSRKPYSMGAKAWPVLAASAKAAKAFKALCRPRMRKASAGIRRCKKISSSSPFLRLRVASAGKARTSQVMPLTSSRP